LKRNSEVEQSVLNEKNLMLPVKSNFSEGVFFFLKRMHVMANEMPF
jgi:hypothetical protein